MMTSSSKSRIPKLQRPQTATSINDEKLSNSVIETKFTAKKFSNNSLVDETQHSEYNVIVGDVIVPKTEMTIKKLRDKKVGQKKKIPLLDGVKSEVDTAQEPSGEKIKVKVLQQTKKIKETDNISAIPKELLDSDKMSNIEIRLLDLEKKYDMLVGLLHAHQIVQSPELNIKLEEQKIKKLDSCVLLHTSENLTRVESEVLGEVAERDSDPTILEEKILENKQKFMNMTFETKSEETLRMNKNFITGHIILKPPLIYQKLQKSIKQFKISNL